MGSVITLIFMCVYLPLAFLSSITPYIMRKTESFGISIPEEKYGDNRLKKLRVQYLRNVLVSNVLILLVCIVLLVVYGEKYMMAMITVTTVLILIVTFLIYLKSHFIMKDIKEQSGWMLENGQDAVAISDSCNKRNAVSLGWFIIPTIISLITLGVGVAQYESMPKEVMMQYDFDGNVIRVARKSVGIILFAPIMQLLMIGLFAFVNKIIGESKQLFDSFRSEKSFTQDKKFRMAWSIYLLLGSIVITLLFGIVQLSIIGLLPVNSVIVICTPIIFTASLIVGAVILSVALGQGGSRIYFTAVKDNSILTRDEDSYWKLGVFYFNPEDPSLWVEKRFGIGWTINFARPWAWGILVGTCIVITVVSILTNMLIK